MLIIVVAALGLMQFWPLSFSNPATISTPNWDSEETKHLAERACFDCHSHETEWPWYSKIVPIANLVVKDVENGRAVFNFSDWEATCCTETQIDAMAETVNKEEMPLPYYLIIHPEAELTIEERGALVNGLIATMRSQVEGSE